MLWNQIPSYLNKLKLNKLQLKNIKKGNFVKVTSTFMTFFLLKTKTQRTLKKKKVEEEKLNN